MSSVFPRNTRINLPKAAHAEECYIFDDSGKAYFDGSGGAAVSCLGHGDPEIISAIQQQAQNLAFAHTGFFTSEPAEKLANLLVDNAPTGLNRAYFVSGGSEAVEAALKLARQYHVENDEPNRRHLVSRRQSYHGNTLGALGAGGNDMRRTQFEPLLIEVNHIAPCYEYMLKDEGEASYDYGQRAAQELEDEILRLGPETVMAFIAEPVVGATMGAVPAVEGYFKKIREICDIYGVLLILDEVMCGMGRTGHLFACEADQVTPDIICIAKGLGAGYQPIGAMICSENVYDVIKTGSGIFQHGHTYLGHPVATAAGYAVVNKIISQNMVAKCHHLGTVLSDALHDRFGQHPYIGDIRGRGLFLGIEMVSDRTTKEPFDPKKQIAHSVKKAAFDAGLICYPMPGTRGGSLGDHILLAPPFVMKEHQISEITDKLDKALREVLPA